MKAYFPNKSKKKRYYGEEVFRRKLVDIAGLFQCVVIDIPDIEVNTMTMAKDEYGVRGVQKGKKRPFDVLLYTPNRTFSLELKYNNGGIKKHQIDTIRKIYECNGSGFFVRQKQKIDKNGMIRGDEYIVSLYTKEVIFRTDSISDLFKFFKEYSGGTNV